MNETTEVYLKVYLEKTEVNLLPSSLRVYAVKLPRLYYLSQTSLAKQQGVTMGGYVREYVDPRRG